VVGVVVTISFFDKVSTATVGASIFIALFMLLCYAMFGFMSYRFKIVVMTDKELIVIMPFRLQYKRFAFENIKDLKWDLWEARRLADYRKLTISTNSGFRMNISDLEFMNYDRLEQWLIKNTNVELNTARKLDIEVKQAKSNRWLNLVAIVMLMIIFFVFLLATPHRENVRLAVLMIIPIVVWRLLVHLVRYHERIKGSE
jgi:hypothetical protein